MKARFLIVFMFCSFTVFSQDISVLRITVSENLPSAYKSAILYNGHEVLDSVISDDKGAFSFIIDTVEFNSDSIYFSIKTEDTLRSNIKIFINKLKLLGIIK